MSDNQKMISVRGSVLLATVLLNAIVLKSGYINNSNHYWWFLLTLPVLALVIYNINQRKHAILRNYPLLGYIRYLMENFRLEIRQYFFESDTDGKPFSRRQRSIVYQRSKNVRQTVAFGMQLDPHQPGYEYLAHTIYPVEVNQRDLRITIGNHQCSQPYSASILNIGAMSFGALSKTAIEALNKGAKMGGFAHNTGEGGISSYHLAGGDLIWQIGSGYFGCRDERGNFDADLFRRNATRPEVKMIELKLSQGAKPGHGGVLPAAKNTEEIAAIRNIVPGTTVLSPARHRVFTGPETMLIFLDSLRRMSNGKPVGFKLCIGSKKEFYEICYAIQKTGIIPDFIVIDGAEGGTGAAPLEFADSVGMPLYDALAFATKTLQHYGIYPHTKIIAAGKIITGFDILKSIALGASACYSARGMMFSLGCIQALKCDSGKCPVGVATQDARLYNGLNVSDKSVRVANFHRNTIKATIELMEACGFESLKDITVSSFFRKLSLSETKSFDEIYKLNSATIYEKEISNLN